MQQLKGCTVEQLVWMEQISGCLPVDQNDGMKSIQSSGENQIIGVKRKKKESYLRFSKNKNKKEEKKIAVKHKRKTPLTEERLSSFESQQKQFYQEWKYFPLADLTVKDKLDDQIVDKRRQMDQLFNSQKWQSFSRRFSSPRSLRKREQQVAFTFITHDYGFGNVKDLLPNMTCTNYHSLLVSAFRRTLKKFKTLISEMKNKKVKIIIISEVSALITQLCNCRGWMSCREREIFFKVMKLAEGFPCQPISKIEIVILLNKLFQRQKSISASCEKQYEMMKNVHTGKLRKSNRKRQHIPRLLPVQSSKVTLNVNTQRQIAGFILAFKRIDIIPELLAKQCPEIKWEGENIIHCLDSIYRKAIFKIIRRSRYYAMEKKHFPELKMTEQQLGRLPLDQLKENVKFELIRIYFLEGNMPFEQIEKGVYAIRNYMKDIGFQTKTEAVTS